MNKINDTTPYRRIIGVYMVLNLFKKPELFKVRMMASPLLGPKVQDFAVGRFPRDRGHRVAGLLPERSHRVLTDLKCGSLKNYNMNICID